MATNRIISNGDLDLICAHREKMFSEAGHDVSTIKEMAPHFRLWLRSSLDSGSYFGRVVEADGHPIASIGLMTIGWPPHPLHPSQDKRGYVLNLYVEVAHRRKGVAMGLMKFADSEFDSRGVGYRILHSTKLARPMYDHLGWTPTSELSKSQ